jgi:pimeloyl-ACP methyl ester carboxylesterase
MKPRRSLAKRAGAFCRQRLIHRTAFLSLLLLVSACATPIGVVRLDTQDVYRSLTANVLSSTQPSDWSVQVLQRLNLFERFDQDPEAALAELRKTIQQQVSEDQLQDRLFTLSELSFLHGENSGRQEYYGASAVYAYAFLFPESGTPPDPLDPRRRLAADLYNLGLTKGLTRADQEEMIIENRTVSLPLGELKVEVNPQEFLWGGYRFRRFIPVGEFGVRGLRNRFRQAGIGAPLAAELAPDESDPAAEAARKRIPPRMKVPVTAFVRITAPRRAVIDGKLAGKLELYPADGAPSVRVGDRDIPLELQPTAALAYMLEGAPVWDFEIAGFRFADEQRLLGDGLFMLHPYRPGRIPVVLVHGTASSPARWAEMINELTHDPVLRGRIQFWLFMYNTGQPVLYSAWLMRHALRDIVAELDPSGQDPALRRMVIIGHSQGGLLSKLMAIHSGTRFWDANITVPFEQVEMAPETRELLREAIFFEPVPPLKRLIFIATPHRGSFRASGFVLNLIRRFVTLPGRLVNQLQGILKQPEFSHLGMSRLPTSVDNMSPGHPFIRALAESRIDPAITAHSIIAVLGEGPITGKTDGMVAYESAHIEGVESEKVVRSPHSTQGHPETIEEVRRILREHIAGVNNNRTLKTWTGVLQNYSTGCYTWARSSSN